MRVVWTSLVRRAFFHDGWGGAERLVRLAALRTQLASDDLDALVRSEAARLRHAAPTLSLASAASLTPKLPLGTAKRERVLVFDGALPSPATDLLGEALPERSRTCYFQLVVPASAVERDVSMLEGGNALGQELAQAIGAKGSKGRRLEGAPRAVQGPLPLCFLYGGTGEHYFWRRRTMVAVPLARDHGIASVIIENPFYGHRRPPGQVCWSKDAKREKGNLELLCFPWSPSRLSWSDDSSAAIGGSFFLFLPAGLDPQSRIRSVCNGDGADA